MTPFFSLLIFSLVLLFICTTYKQFFALQLKPIFINYFENDINKSKSVYVKNSSVKRICTTKAHLTEVYNKKLKAHLKLLNYILTLEMSTSYKGGEQQVAEILSIKTQVQKDIIDLTQKINRLH